MELVERRVGTGRTVGLHATDAGLPTSAEGVRREFAPGDRTCAALEPDRFDMLVALLEEARDGLLVSPDAEY